MNIKDAINYLHDSGYEVNIKNANTYLFNDPDDSIRENYPEVYDKKELIQFADTMKEEAYIEMSQEARP